MQAKLGRELFLRVLMNQIKLPQTQYAKFGTWSTDRLIEHDTSRPKKLPTILIFLQVLTRERANHHKYLSASFEHLCYESTAIIPVSLFQWGIFFSGQNLTSKIDHRTEKGNHYIINHAIALEESLCIK